MSKSAVSKIKALRAPDGAWEIPIVGEIGQFSGEMLLDFLMNVKPTEVKFLVRSPGGTVFDVFDAIDYMNANGITSFTEVYGDCMSAVTLLAAHSTPARTAVTASARYGIHKASGGLGDQVFVAHANERIAEMYAKAYGWNAGKVDKLLSANDGTGTVWMGQEILDAGIASELLGELKVAARMDRVDHIINNNTMKVKAKLVSGWDTVKALVAGQEVEVEVDAKAVEAASAEELTTAKTALDQATKDRQSAEAKEKEATDKVSALETKLKELEEQAKTANEGKAAETTKVTEVTAKFDEATKNVANLQRELAKALDQPAGAPPIQVDDKGIVSPLKGPSQGPQDPGAQLKAEVLASMTPLERSIARSNAQKRQAAEAKTK